MRRWIEKHRYRIALFLLGLSGVTYLGGSYETVAGSLFSTLSFILGFQFLVGIWP